MNIPTFVVGTGRCGSTMLSNMLREHPKVLSLSEFYAWATDCGREDQPFGSERLDGTQFWSIIAAITPFVSFILRQRIEPSELLYPVDDPAARYGRESGVPAILLTTLPHLTADHDRLYDDLRREVCGWELAETGEHYRRLFGRLAQQFARRAWIERSGGGLVWLEQLSSIFPDARFVHIVRDGRDAAISMSEHVGFRLFYLHAALGGYLGVDPLYSDDRSLIDSLPENLGRFLPERFDRAAFKAFRCPLPLCGEAWSEQIVIGLERLRVIAADRLLTLRYEDFFTDPKAQLDALATFLGEEFVDDGWSTRCAETVRPPRSSWRDLPTEEARALSEACRPGFAQLAAAGIRYDV